jgi:uncharacterized membrane protein YoaK (UPF0700 family)
MYTMVVCGGGEESHVSTFAKMALVMLVTAFVLGVLAHYRIRKDDIELGLALIQFSLLFVALGGVMQMFWPKTDSRIPVNPPLG